MIDNTTARDVVRTIQAKLADGGKYEEALVDAMIEHALPVHQCAYVYQAEMKHGPDGRPLSLLSDIRNWPELKEGETEIGYSSINVVDDSLVGELAKSIANTVQFPVNTAFMHGLGVVASACSWRFKYDIYGTDTNPVNLYVITSQPPSTGKSAVNNFFTTPIHTAAKDINADRQAKRIKLEADLAEEHKQLKGSGDIARKEKAEANIVEIQEQIKAECSHVRFIMTDGTAEALEQTAFNQDGMINIVSDEADAVNVVLGSVYRSGDSKANHGLVLKAWDGGYHSSARITRECGEGFVRGSIAVIAQDESITSVIEAGMSGRGISERILLLREKNLLGQRNHSSAYVPVDKALLARYGELIDSILKEDDVVLTFDAESHSVISDYRQNIERKLGDSGCYSHTLLRGAFGKADKQIHKLACILHIIDNWQPGGSRSKQINYETTGRAIVIYDQLKLAYIDALEGHGAAGEKALIEATKDRLKAFVEKKKRRELTVKELRDSCFKSQPFNRQPNLTRMLRDEVLPSLANEGAIAFYGNGIYVSPYLLR